MPPKKEYTNKDLNGKKPKEVEIRPKKVTINAEEALTLENALRVNAYVRLNEPNMSLATCPSCRKVRADFNFKHDLPGEEPCDECRKEKKSKGATVPIHLTNRTCHHCSITKSTIWRHDNEGNPLCNPCGQYLHRHGVPRPDNLLQKTVIHKRRSKSQGKPTKDDPGHEVVELDDTDDSDKEDVHRSARHASRVRSYDNDTPDTDLCVVSPPVKGNKNTTAAPQAKEIKLPSIDKMKLPSIQIQKPGNLPRLGIPSPNTAKKGSKRSFNGDSLPSTPFMDLTLNTPVISPRVHNNKNDPFRASIDPFGPASLAPTTPATSSAVRQRSPKGKSREANPSPVQPSVYQDYPWLALRDVVFMMQQMTTPTRISPTDMCKVLQYRYGKIHPATQHINEETLQEIYKYCTIKCNLDWSRKGGIVWDRKGNITAGIDSGNTFYERNRAVMDVIAGDILMDLQIVKGGVAGADVEKAGVRKKLPTGQDISEEWILAD